MNKTIAKYLDQYAEPISAEYAKLNSCDKRQFALIIPAYKESFDFVTRLEQHPQANDICLFLVLNEPASQANNNENNDFYTSLADNALRIEQKGKLELWQFKRLLIVLIKQIGQDALPDKQGVGLARKLGADIAVKAISLNRISQAWLFSSDADAHLPDNYFDLDFKAEFSAWVFNFHHYSYAIDSRTEDARIIQQATDIYERCIKYYSAQLLAAGSPYSYPSLGSCLSVSLLHYCQARGFPKRAAAEDFYLLNKLTKLAPIGYADHIEIGIEARLSDRVPFGTGPAVAKLLCAIKQNTPIKYYNPALFKALAELLNGIERIWNNAPDCDAKNPSSSNALADLPLTTQNALIDAGFLDFLNKRRKQDKNYEQFKRNFHQWFDAFQTLKFIKRLQNSAYSELDISAIAEL